MKTQNEIIKENNLKLKKSLGQNFLKDTNTINKIINCADINEEDTIIEIGPGAGAMTRLIIDRCKSLIAVEIDSNLFDLLSRDFKEYSNFKIINEDFLKISANDIDIIKTGKVKVVANLPYYITSAIISKILLEFEYIDEIYIMVQKEVAERITSAAKNKSYGSLSVFCQSLCDVKYEFTVPKTVFIPPPKIDSAIISLKRTNFNLDIYNFQKFVKNCFKQKRKTLVNNINYSYHIEKSDIISFLESNNFSSKIRSEHIEVKEFQKLYLLFKERFGGVM